MRYPGFVPLACVMLGSFVLVSAACSGTPIPSKESRAPFAAGQAPQRTATPRPTEVPRSTATASGDAPDDKKA
jgi:hypothetical protein